MTQDTQVVSAKASGAASTSVNSLGKPAALARLEPFLILAKSARGAAAAKLIAEATAAPGCYVFSELADTDAVRQVGALLARSLKRVRNTELTSSSRQIAADPAYAQTVALLQLFQFGTLSRYLENVSSYPNLTAAHLSKLRQLTLATLASQSRILPYQELSKALRLDVHLDAEGHVQSGIASSSSSDGGRAVLSASAIRALEDVVIDAIYAGLLSGRLDQQKARFHVDWVIGRDVAGDEEIVTMEKQLAEW